MSPTPEQSAPNEAFEAQLKTYAELVKAQAQKEGMTGEKLENHVQHNVDNQKRTFGHAPDGADVLQQINTELKKQLGEAPAPNERQPQPHVEPTPSLSPERQQKLNEFVASLEENGVEIRRDKKGAIDAPREGDSIEQGLAHSQQKMEYALEQGQAQNAGKTSPAAEQPAPATGTQIFEKSDEAEKAKAAQRQHDQKQSPEKLGPATDDDIKQFKAQIESSIEGNKATIAETKDKRVSAVATKANESNAAMLEYVDAMKDKGSSLKDIKDGIKQIHEEAFKDKNGKMMEGVTVEGTRVNIDISKVTDFGALQEAIGKAQAAFDKAAHPERAQEQSKGAGMGLSGSPDPFAGQQPDAQARATPAATAPSASAAAQAPASLADNAARLSASIQQDFVATLQGDTKTPQQLLSDAQAKLVETFDRMQAAGGVYTSSDAVAFRPEAVAFKAAVDNVVKASGQSRDEAIATAMATKGSDSMMADLKTSQAQMIAEQVDKPLPGLQQQIAQEQKVEKTTAELAADIRANRNEKNAETKAFNDAAEKLSTAALDRDNATTRPEIMQENAKKMLSYMEKNGADGPAGQELKQTLTDIAGGKIDLAHNANAVEAAMAVVEQKGAYRQEAKAQKRDTAVANQVEKIDQLAQGGINREETAQVKAAVGNIAHNLAMKKTIDKIPLSENQTQMLETAKAMEHGKMDLAEGAKKLGELAANPSKAPTPLAVTDAPGKKASPENRAKTEDVVKGNAPDTRQQLKSQEARTPPAAPNLTINLQQGNSAGRTA